MRGKTTENRKKVSGKQAKGYAHVNFRKEPSPNRARRKDGKNNSFHYTSAAEKKAQRNALPIRPRPRRKAKKRLRKPVHSFTNTDTPKRIIRREIQMLAQRH
jgi:hypothetical protein